LILFVLLLTMFSTGCYSYSYTCYSYSYTSCSPTGCSPTGCSPTTLTTTYCSYYYLLLLVAAMVAVVHFSHIEHSSTTLPTYYLLHLLTEHKLLVCKLLAGTPTPTTPTTPTTTPTHTCKLLVFKLCGICNDEFFRTSKKCAEAVAYAIVWNFLCWGSSYDDEMSPYLWAPKLWWLVYHIQATSLEAIDYNGENLSQICKWFFWFYNFVLFSYSFVLFLYNVVLFLKPCIPTPNVNEKRIWSYY
jgi:hypothetical protein